ncbi:MAG TPA: TonB-dependent receptor [Lentimicrobium sp.]|nr:TonB-dependent receptor [Lentimicrobium sp.]
MKRIGTLLLLFLFSLYAWSQGRTITGTVSDEAGNGIPGVTVLLVGTTSGAVTDLDGKFIINASQSQTLRFSYVGYIAQEVVIGTQNVINITLVEELTELNEVVVIGYGTQKKKDVSTAVVVVDDEAIKERPIVNAAQALQGKAAGVQVVQNSGKPGASMSVRVRGATSVLASNEPLYVVDGLMTSDISSINPNDIISLTVLKDATSQAIYGARGANGVVIITTKRGEANVPTISFNTYGGASWLRKPIDVLNTKQYRALMEELQPGSWDPSWTSNTDWSDEVFGTGWQQSYQLSFSGGDAVNRYYVSGNYYNEIGMARPARFDRYSVRLNLDNQLRSWLKLSTNLSISQINTKDTPDNLSSGRGGVIMSALNTPPFLSIYSKDTINEKGWFDPNPFQPSWENPVAYMEGPDQRSIDRRILGSLEVEAKIINGLYYRPRLGFDILNHMWDYYLDPIRTGYGRQNNGIGQSDKSSTFYWVIDNIIEYTTSIDKHNLSFMAGSVVESNRYDQSYEYGTDFPPDWNVQTLNAANTISASTGISERTGASFIGRITYNYANKYYFLANYRRDGTSVLTHKWDDFPSASIAWRISAEPFMEGINFIDDLKLRAGYGLLGNSVGIGDYAPYGVIGFIRRPPTNPLSGPAVVQESYGNFDLQWEKTGMTNFGLDFTSLGGRLVLTLDAYIKKTEDVILPVQLSSTLPITELRTNAGKIENRGIEFSINSINSDGEFKWATDLNMSFNKNEVTDLQYTKVYYFGRVYSNNQDAVIVKEGMSLGSFFGYISEGVDPETGDIIYKDVNGNGILEPGDRTVIGQGMPDFTYGLTNRFSFKKFDLNIFIQGTYGNDIFNATRIDLEGMFDSKNQSAVVLDRWTPENTNTDIPRARFGNYDNVRNSTRFVEDGSYLRLKSVTLSYKILENAKTLKLLSVYITGNNLVTLTKYEGFDPEVSQYGSTGTSPGFDYGTYPQARSIIVGINVNL